MTLQTALDTADQLKPNMMTRQLKISFLTELEQLIYNEIIRKHEPKEPGDRMNPFLKVISDLIRGELLMAEEHDKERVLSFIESIYGQVRQKILFEQYRMPPEVELYMKSILQDLTDTIAASAGKTKEELVAFLEALKEVVDGHITGGSMPPAYDTDTDAGTVLLAPDPYSIIYVYWLMSKIDMQNLEEDKWDQDTQRFEQAWGTLSDWWTRTHMPVMKNRQFRI